MIVIVGATGTNYTSILSAVRRAGYDAIVSDDIDVIAKASYVVLPGVGHAEYAMARLVDKNLSEEIKTLKQPVLGICLGMQLMFTRSEEGQTDCLGIIPDEIVALRGIDVTLPHMGWNLLQFSDNKNPLALDLPSKAYVYFVHSYAAKFSPYTVATTTHGESFSAIVKYKNFYGMQFHPERSGRVGQQLLENFLKL